MFSYNGFSSFDYSRLSHDGGSCDSGKDKPSTNHCSSLLGPMMHFRAAIGGTADHSMSPSARVKEERKPAKKGRFSACWHPLNARARWCERFGAMRLLDDPLKLILPLTVTAEAITTE